MRRKIYKACYQLKGDMEYYSGSETHCTVYSMVFPMEILPKTKDSQQTLRWVIATKFKIYTWPKEGSVRARSENMDITLWAKLRRTHAYPKNKPSYSLWIKNKAWLNVQFDTWGERITYLCVSQISAISFMPGPQTLHIQCQQLLLSTINNNNTFHLLGQHKQVRPEFFRIYHQAEC